MVLWHTRVQVIRRQMRDGKGNVIPGKHNSAVEAAAYRGALKLRDERTGEVFDYTRKQKGVVSSVILAPAGLPDRVRDPQALFNAVERREDDSNKHATAQLLREVEFSLPLPLDRTQNEELAHRWGERLVNMGMVVQVSIHEPKPYRGQRNPHVHFLFTMREMLPNGEFGLKVREWNGDWKQSKNDTELYDRLLDGWQDDVNAALAGAGLSERVDRRSFKEHGIDRVPSVHLGRAATAMERRGMTTERGKRAEIAAMTNAMLPHIRDVERYGEVQQHGVGSTWWERALVSIGQTGTQAGGDPPQGGPPAAAPGAAAPGWREYVTGRRADDKEPERER